MTDQRLRKLQITEIESSANVLAARIKSSGETENGDRQFILDVEATGLVKPGRHRELITLHTNDEEYPLIQLPVVIERRSGEDDPVPDSGRVIIDPPTLRLTTAAGSTADCVVQTQNGDPIRVKQITTDPPFVSAGHTQVVGTADAFRLRVSIDETLPKQKLRAIVSIQTVDGRELTVPVQIIPAAE